MIDEHGKDFGPSSTVSQDEAHEVPDEKGSAEDMSDPDIADEDDEDTRSFRTNAWEEDDTFIPSITDHSLKVGLKRLVAILRACLCTDFLVALVD